MDACYLMSRRIFHLVPKSWQRRQAFTSCKEGLADQGEGGGLDVNINFWLFFFGVDVVESGNRACDYLSE